MSFNGSGTFVINSSGQPVVANTVISSTVFNALTADLATGLSTCITKDGQTTPTANIPMGTFKFTNLGNGSAATDSATLGQVQASTTKLVTVSGTDTITGTMTPALTAYASGQMFYFVAGGANTGAVTLNIDGLGARNVTRHGSVALVAGDILSGEVCVVVYDGTRFQLLNPASYTNLNVTGVLALAAGTALLPSLTFTGDLNTGLWSPAADTIAASTGGSERMRLDASGNLGIGTASPTVRFEVATAGGAVAAGRFYSPSTTNGARLELADNNTNFSLRTIPAGGTTDLSFTRDGTSFEVMRLTYGGNVGIGTTPSAWRSGARAIQAGAAGYVSLWEQANGSANLAFAAYESAANTFAYRTTGDAPTLYSQVTGIHTWSNAVAGTANNTFSFTERMRLDSSGNLGIGTASPSVASGIGIAVNGGASAARLALKNNSTGDASMDGFQLAVSGSDAFIEQRENASLILSTNGVERMRLDQNGNVIAGGSVALATNATNGFLYVPTCAGTPTGTPGAITGMAPIVVNTTNNKLYFYSGGAWRDAGP